MPQLCDDALSFTVTGAAFRDSAEFEERESDHRIV